MSEYKPNWLPDLVLFEYCSCDWDVYVEVIYDIFRRDFIESYNYLNGERISIKREPFEKGKEATFWHLISEDSEESGKEDERIPNFRRCERIGWPMPIIKNYSDDPRIKYWKNEKNGERNILFWFNDEYLVVLAERSTYLLFKTAYPIEYNNRKRRLQKEYESYWK